MLRTSLQVVSEEIVHEEYDEHDEDEKIVMNPELVF